MEVVVVIIAISKVRVVVVQPLLRHEPAVRRIIYERIAVARSSHNSSILRIWSMALVKDASSLTS